MSPATADQAEAAFYTAFEAGDVDAMASLWERSANVVCVHPNAPQLMGYEQVMQSWRDILRNTAGFRISVQVIQHYTDEQVAVRFVNETLIDESSRAAPVTVAATNAYQKTESGWRMVLHHASPASAVVEGTGPRAEDAPDSGRTLH